MKKELLSLLTRGTNIKKCIFPTILMLGWNFIVYNCSRIITKGLTHYDLTSIFDDIIPFCAPFILIYIGSYVQWVFGFYYSAMTGVGNYYYLVSSEMIAKSITLLCFLIVPTFIRRPVVGGEGFLEELVKLVYLTDSPDNLFPSVHCMESWILYRITTKRPGFTEAYSNAMFLMTLLVCSSVVLVKQHVIVDIFGGIIVAESGLLISEKTNASRILYSLKDCFSKIWKKFHRKKDKFN